MQENTLTNLNIQDVGSSSVPVSHIDIIITSASLLSSCPSWWTSLLLLSCSPKHPAHLESILLCHLVCSQSSSRVSSANIACCQGLGAMQRVNGLAYHEKKCERETDFKHCGRWK